MQCFRTEKPGSAATIEPRELVRLKDQGAAIDLIDVRTPVEYASLHAEGARLVPLDQLDVRSVLAQRNGDADQPVYLICKAGARAGKACEKFLAEGFERAISVEGGTEAWEKAGLPVVRGRKRMSLERQVRIAAGLMVLIGAILALVVHPAWAGLSAFVGAGLVFSGITDSCGMGLLLAKMPWNRCAA